MGIPDFQSIMLPLLKHLSDGRDHTNKETLDHLAEVFQLSDEQLTYRLPSGNRVFANRIAWAKVRLKLALLIEAPQRGVYRITDRGQEFLAKDPTEVTIETLMEYPEYREYIEKKKLRRKAKRGKTSTSPEAAMEPAEDLTPEEQLDQAYESLRENIASEILEKVMECSPQFFEDLVVELLVAMGYGGSRHDAGQTLGQTGDGGVDGVIKEDRLGLDSIYLQAKRWKGTKVGRPEIQKFAGALQGKKARKGVFITTSDFSNEALEFADFVETSIVLIDGEQLAQLMIDHGIGVSLVSRYEIKRIDSDYFEEN